MNSQPLLIYGLLAGAYLLGSIPWGVLLTRGFGAADPRRHGSGNIGATNVPGWAGSALTGDPGRRHAQGSVPVWLCMAWAADSSSSEVFPVAAALLSFFGTCFRFTAGCAAAEKGRHAFGGFSAIAPAAVLAAVCAFAVGFLISRRVSIGSLAAALALPFAVYATTASWMASAGAALASIFIFIPTRRTSGA